jgi:hypothetical protein
VLNKPNKAIIFICNFLPSSKIKQINPDKEMVTIVVITVKAQKPVQQLTEHIKEIM